jgi:hypothetical protein
VLLVLALCCTGVWILRGGRPSRWIAVPITAALAFWALTGLSFVPGREAVASRYQLIDAALLMVIAAEVLRPVRLRGWRTTVLVAIALAVVISNSFSLRSGYRFLRDQSTYAKAEIGALEIARGHTSPDLGPTDALTLNPYVGAITAGRYFDETDEHGSIAHLSPSEISAAPLAARVNADGVLISAYRIRLAQSDRAARGRGCRRFAAGIQPTELGIPPGTTLLANLGAKPLAISSAGSPRDTRVPLGFWELAPPAR